MMNDEQKLLTVTVHFLLTQSTLDLIKKIWGFLNRGLPVCIMNLTTKTMLPVRARPDITSGPEVRQIFKCPDSGLPVF